MGKKNEIKAPEVNAAQLLQQQTAGNRQAAQDTLNINAIDTYNPFGQLTYGRDDSGNVTSRTEAFNPLQQKIFDEQQNLSNRLSGFANRQADFIPQNAFNIGDLGLQTVGSQLNFNDLDSVQGFDSGRRQQIEDATLNRFSRFNDPEFKSQDSALAQSLADRGLVEGDEAANRERDRLFRQQQFAREGAQDRAITAGAAEEARLFGQSLAARQSGISDQQANIGIQQQARTQGLNEALAQRSQPFNELSAYLQGSPSLTAPQFQQMAQTQINPADVMGANALQTAAQQNAYNQQQADNRAITQGYFGLGGAALGAGGAAATGGFAKGGRWAV